MARTCLLLATLVVSARSFASQNISDAFWACDPNTNANIFFPNGSLTADCGKEVLQGEASVMPTIKYFNETAPEMLNYTILVIDRDAPNRVVGAPRRHACIVNVPQLVLQDGLTPALVLSTPGINPIVSYGGPRPGAGSSCHRYYVFLFAQEAESSPTLDPVAVPAAAWDFVAWSEANNLTFVNATSYWQTQAESARVGACGAPSPAPAPTPAAQGATAASQLEVGLGVGLGLGGLALVVGAAAWVRHSRRARGAKGQGKWEAGAAEVVVVEKPLALK